MASYILKDKNGNPLTYENMPHIKVPCDSGEDILFTDMSKLNCYYATYDEATSSYTIVGTWFWVREAGYLIAGSNGEYAILFTTKSLVTGETYHTSELGGV